MITAVLVLHLLGGGVLEITADPPVPVATVEECREQLDAIYAEVAPVIAGDPRFERVVGECRRYEPDGEAA